jgi:hypothetical protein
MHLAYVTSRLRSPELKVEMSRWRFASPVAKPSHSTCWVPAPTPQTSLCSPSPLFPPSAFTTLCFHHPLLSPPSAFTTLCFHHPLLSPPSAFTTLFHRHKPCPVWNRLSCHNERRLLQRPLRDLWTNGPLDLAELILTVESCYVLNSEL